MNGFSVKIKEGKAGILTESRNRSEYVCESWKGSKF